MCDFGMMKQTASEYYDRPTVKVNFLCLVFGVCSSFKIASNTKHECRMNCSYCDCVCCLFVHKCRSFRAINKPFAVTILNEYHNLRPVLFSLI